MLFSVKRSKDFVFCQDRIPEANPPVDLFPSAKYNRIMQEDTVYTSEVRIERVKGPLRRAYLPGNNQPVLFGVHSAVAEHYKVNIEEHEPHTTTLDYVVAAAAG